MAVYVEVAYHSETSQVEFTSQISQIYSEYVFETKNGTLSINEVEVSVKVDSSVITIDLGDGPIEGETMVPLQKSSRI